MGLPNLPDPGLLFLRIDVLIVPEPACRCILQQCIATSFA